MEIKEVCKLASGGDIRLEIELLLAFSESMADPSNPKVITEEEFLAIFRKHGKTPTEQEVYDLDRGLTIEVTAQDP